MIVEEIMSDKLVTVDVNDTVKNACDKYRDNKVGCLVVTDNEKIAGIVTERDVIERTICMDLNPNSTSVKEIMSSDIKTVNSYDRVEDALEIMKTNKIKKLPVVSNNRLVGIITITDIAYTRPSIKKFLEIKQDMVKKNRFI